MQDTKPISTSFASYFRLSKEQSPTTEIENAHMDKTPYAFVVGSFMYTMVCIRPDIAHAIGIVSRYMSNPRKQYWKAVK